MGTITESPFDSAVDESLKVMHEEFMCFRDECKSVEDVVLLIREEIRNPEIDFVKIVALGLTGEALHG